MAKNITSDIPGDDDAANVREDVTLVVPTGVDEDGEVTYVRLTFDASDKGRGIAARAAYMGLPKPLRTLVEGDPESHMIDVPDPDRFRVESRGNGNGTPRRHTSAAERAENKRRRGLLIEAGWDIREGGKLPTAATDALAVFDETGEVPAPPAEYRAAPTLSVVEDGQGEGDSGEQVAAVVEGSDGE